MNQFTSNARGRSHRALIPLVAFAVALVCTLPASAVVPGERVQVAAIPDPVDVSLQLELSSREVWRDFLQRQGDWTVVWDEETGLPERAFSRGFPLLAEIPTEANVVEATRSFIEVNAEVFGVNEDQVEVIYAQNTPRHWVVLYRQHHNGIPVEGSQITFFVNDQGRLAMFGTRRVVEDLRLEQAPILVARYAERLFQDAMMPEGIPATETVLRDDAELVILRRNTWEAPRLTWKVGFITEQTPHHYVGYVDSETGEILRWSDEIYHVDVEGRVEARGHEDHPGTPIIVQDMPEIRVQVQGGNSAFADANGNFVVPHSGSNPVNVSVTVEGRWTSVNNTRGGEVSNTESFTPGVSETISVNPSDTSQFTVAQIDAFIHMTRVHEFMKRVMPNVTIFDRSVPANVNISSSCNAFWNGSSTNYYNRAGSCNNTAFASVVYHEYGHGADHYAGGILDGGLSEGFGDILSIYILGYPTIGPYFFTSGGGIRTGTNNRRWPARECNGQVHCMGETWMGFAWHARANMINNLGSTLGALAAEQAVIPTFVSNPDKIPDAVLDTFVFDDDNGDLSDGTPNFDQLAGAANIKNFDIPAPPSISSYNPSEVGRCSAFQIIVNGSFFIENGTEVRIGGLEADVVEINRGAGFLRANLPEDLGSGIHDLSVATPFGVAVIPNALDVNADPEITLDGAMHVGGPALLEVCGIANADYFVAASLSEGSETFEGAQLDLGRRIFILRNSFSGPDAPLDGNGNTSIQIQVPNNPNLNFVSPLFQVAVRNGGSWNVSAVTRTTIFP